MSWLVISIAQNVGLNGLGSLAPVERALREAFDGLEAQVGSRAVIVGAHFWYAFLRALAEESRRQFVAQNKNLAEVNLEGRVRLLEGPINHAIREILTHPERFFQDWL